MAKVSEEAKKQYYDSITSYKSVIEQAQMREKNLRNIIQHDENGAPYKKLILAEEGINMVSYYVLMNSLSLNLLGIKNENFLNDARKRCYQSIIYLEGIVTSYIDVPFSEYEEKLALIEGYDDEKRYNLIRKTGFAVESVKEAFGVNTKWKWSFVELEGRMAVVSKNLLNLRELVKQLDPRVELYEIRMSFLNLVKRQLQQAADRYREKYELSTQRLDDFKLAIDYLAALRRIHMIVGERDKAEDLKKKVDIWRTKMDKDQQSIDKSRKSAPPEGKK
ncbi:MAG: hypothetical protein K9L75_03550 [Spirochaetia bacterium]|nr:hypothetical protein [Spirochaetales bacterium]MCF7944595.1 hypothetical protein [Spirochaetia bacterium]